MLTNVLNDDLNAVRSGFEPLFETSSEAFHARWDEGTRALLGHVLRHEAIYSGGNTSSAVALRGVLAHHMTESIKRLIDKGVWHAGLDRDEAAQLIAAYHGQAAAAAIEAWLTLPAPRDIELIIDVLWQGTRALWDRPAPSNGTIRP